MDVLYLLIPVSAVLVLAIVAIFGWAVQAGQFDDLEGEGERLMQGEPRGVDEAQPPQGEVRPETGPSRVWLV